MKKFVIVLLASVIYALGVGTMLRAQVGQPGISGCGAEVGGSFSGSGIAGCAPDTPTPGSGSGPSCSGAIDASNGCPLPMLGM